MSYESNDKIVATLQRFGGKEEWRVYTGCFNGHDFVGVRLWFLGSDGSWRPSKKGITFRPNETRDVGLALIQAAKDLQKYETKKAELEPQTNEEEVPF